MGSIHRLPFDIVPHTRASTSSIRTRVNLPLSVVKRYVLDANQIIDFFSELVEAKEVSSVKPYYNNIFTQNSTFKIMRQREVFDS